MQQPGVVSDRVSVFVALKVPGQTGCHITITMAKDTTKQHAAQMEQDWNACFGGVKHLGLEFEVGNYKKMGSDHQFEAYKCRAVTPGVYEALNSFHRRHYMGKRGKRLFPNLSLHITVDTPQRMQEVESIILNLPPGSAKRGCFTVGEFIFEVRDQRAEQEVNAIFASDQWHNGQWKRARGEQQQAAYYDAPSAPIIPAVAPQQSQAPKRRVFYDDWACPQCGDLHQFGSRTHCRQCGGPRPAWVKTK